MKARKASAWLLVAAILAAGSPIAGQGPLLVPEIELVWTAGEALLSIVTGYIAGKAIDKVRGEDTETQLKKVIPRLESQINKSNVNRKAVENALAVAQQELKIAQKLRTGGATKAELAKYRQELTTDIETIKTTLQEHERHLADHDRQLAEQGKLIQKQGEKLEDFEHRLDQRQTPPTVRVPPDRGPAPRRPSYGPAGELTIEVRGAANSIHLREANHPVRMGRFRISQSRSQAAYFFSPSNRVVIELFAPDNHIFMPSYLASQVQIVSNGWHYETLVY